MLFKIDIVVPNSIEESLVDFASELGLQSYSSPEIESAGGGEEDIKFTGNTTVSILVSTVENDVQLIESKIRDYLEKSNVKFFLSKRAFSDNEDWMANFRANFSPIQVSKTVLVCPPWYYTTGETMNSQTTVIVINPGMAFGTGTHETTRLCLQVLESLAPFSGEYLDCGAGSGILSFYLVKNQAKRVVAIEIDGPAVENLRENAALNGVESNMEIKCIDLRFFKPEQRFSGIVANLTTPILLDNFHRFREWLTPNGWALFSGVNSSNKQKVKRALKSYWKTIQEKQEGEWYAFLALD